MDCLLDGRRVVGRGWRRSLDVAVTSGTESRDAPGQARCHALGGPPAGAMLSAGPNPSAGRPLPELVRQLGYLVAGPFQVRGPRQHALKGRLTAVGELADHRGVAPGTPDDRVADRGSVAGVSVRVQEQMEPPVPVGCVTETGSPGDLRRQQRHPGQRRERQVILAPGRAGSVPVDEAGQGAVGPYGVPRRRIQMSDQKPRPPRPTGEPDGVCGRSECRGRVVQPPKPGTDLPERVVGAQPIRPWLGLAQRLSWQERQAFAALVIEAAGPRGAAEAGVFQMPQHRVHGHRPRLRGAADFVADAYGSESAPAGQPPFGHLLVLPRSDLPGDRIIDSVHVWAIMTDAPRAKSRLIDEFLTVELSKFGYMVGAEERGRNSRRKASKDKARALDVVVIGVGSARARGEDVAADGYETCSPCADIADHRGAEPAQAGLDGRGTATCLSS